jgi:SAM-dependent methyltransferase
MMDSLTKGFQTSAEAQRAHYDRKVQDLLRGGSIEVREVPFKYFSAYHHILQAMGDVNGRKLLDFGCGEGDWSIFFAVKGARVYAFDISPNQVELTNRKIQAKGLTNIEAQVMNAGRLGYADNSFDLVFGSGVLHHLTDTQIYSALSEVKRVLKRGGRAFFLEPIGNNRLLVWLSGKLIGNDFSIDRPLTSDYLVKSGGRFSQVELKEFRVFSRVERFSRSRKWRAFICQMDNSVINRLSFLRKLGSVAVVTYVKGN